MAEFTLAFAAFLVAHVAPAAFGLRDRLIAALGRRSYLIAYSVVSVALLVWVIWSARRAPYIALWPPSPAVYAVPLVLMPIALALFGAGAARANPMSVSLRGGGRDEPVAGVLAITRHPILWAFLLWSGAHLVANGDLVAVILFGSLALFSAVGMVALDRRARRRLGTEAWVQRARVSPAIPFAALRREGTGLRFDRRDLIGAAAGLAIYAAMLMGGHVWLFGVVPYWP